MNFKTTLILLVLLAAAGGYIAWDRYRNADSPENATAKANPGRLFDLADAADVTSLSIRGADSEIVLNAVPEPEKKETKPDSPFAELKPTKQWRMVKPVESAANSAEVNTLVEELVRLESKAKVDPAGKGLDKPKYNVEMAAKGGKILKFAVGDRSPIGELYLRVEGKPKADVVAASIYDRLTKPANDLRDTKLVTAKSTDINELKIETEGQTLLLQKKGNDWQLAEPRQFPADSTAINDLLTTLTSLRATDWIAKDSPDVSKARFDKPLMTVSFATPAPKPTTPPTPAPAAASGPSAAPVAASKPAPQPVWTSITFGQYEDVSKEKLYARVSDSQAVVKVAATAFDTFTKKPLDLRDRKVADILPDQVSKLSIQTEFPGGPAPSATPVPPKKTFVSIERRKQTTPDPAAKPGTPPAPPSWALLTEPKGDADDDAIKALLADLHPLTVTKYLEVLPPSTPVATHTLNLTTEGPGGTPVTNHLLTLIDPGSEKSLLGTYNGLSFEIPRTILPKLEGNFAKKKPPVTPAVGPGAPGNPADVFTLEPTRK